VSTLAIVDVTSRDVGRVRLALEAMATRFELVLDGPDPVRLRAAGEEALDEILRLDRQLSFYRRASDITWINGLAADDAVRVEPGLFRLLQRCQALSAATDGAFDVTVAPLMRAWRFVADSGAVPDEAALAAARQSVGHTHLQLDPDTLTISFAKRGMGIDLGAAGKGYAIDQAMHILRAHGVTHALLHGGTSSIHALGALPDGRRWQIGWNPPGGRLRRFELRDSALSVSAVHGKAFVADGRTYGHVMDPRTGLATAAARAAAVTGPGSLECDALSTALLILGPAWLPSLRAKFPGYDGEVA
jgi:thiamine biosynthesis lipoprotein